MHYSKRRLWLFRLTAIIIPFVVFVLVELAFRIIPGLNEDRDPYVNISPVSVFSRKTIEGKEYYCITHRYVLGGQSVRILVKKPANAIRIFCVGSSACAGWPHPSSETRTAASPSSVIICSPWPTGILPRLPGWRPAGLRTVVPGANGTGAGVADAGPFFRATKNPPWRVLRSGASIR